MFAFKNTSGKFQNFSVFFLRLTSHSPPIFSFQVAGNLGTNRNGETNHPFLPGEEEESEEETEEEDPEEQLLKFF